MWMKHLVMYNLTTTVTTRQGKEVRGTYWYCQTCDRLYLFLRNKYNPKGHICLGT
jgi:hypothetical protein